MTAATHGLSDESEQLEQQLNSAGLPIPTPNPSATLLQPPPPIAQAESNWPLLTVSKGFFDGAMAARNASASAAVVADDDDAAAADGWGDDADLALDDEDKPAAPAAAAAGGESGDEEGGWEVGDEDLDLPSDLAAVVAADDGAGYYAPPSRGQSAAQGFVTGSQLAADHATAGSYETAFRLLHDQIAVVHFEPFKTMFAAAFSRSRTSFAALPNLPSLNAYPLRNWKEASAKVPGLPPVGVRLADLAQRLQVFKTHRNLFSFFSILFEKFSKFFGRKRSEIQKCFFGLCRSATS